MENTKRCSKCGRELPLSEFNKRKASKDGLQPYCKECIKQHNNQYRARHAEEISAYLKQWRVDNPEYFKQYNAEHRDERNQYHAEHRDEQKEYNKKYYAEHRDEQLEKKKQYYAEHAEEIIEYKKHYYQVHREERLEYQKQYNSERYATIEYYAYVVRRDNLRADRKYGRCGEDEDLLPSLEYYIWALQQPDFYDGKQYDWSEMGLDRIYNDKPHTFANVVPCSTANNLRRQKMSFEEFVELMRKEKEELNFI